MMNGIAIDMINVLHIFLDVK